MALLQNLVTNKPSENSGSRAANRFAYQKDWALIKMLELHQKGTDYLFVLDYHDDVLILDSEINPQKAAFYQIKTKKSGNWTVSSLIKPDKSETGSILNSKLGKLFLNKVNFPAETDTINYVSNGTYNIKLTNGKNLKDLIPEVVALSDVCPEEQNKISLAINTELSIKNCSTMFDKAYLHLTPLSLTDHKNHAMGRVAKFLEETSNHKIHPDVFYKMIYGEIEVRNDYEQEIGTIKDLMEFKSLGKGTVQTIINRLDPTSSLDEEWKQIKGNLLMPQFPINLFEIKRIEKSWKQIELDFMNKPSLSHLQLQKIIKHLIETNVVFPESYFHLINEVYCAYEKIDKIDIPIHLFDKEYVQAMILMEYTIM